MTDSASHAGYAAGGTSSRSPVQIVTAVVSATFLLVGILGFIPGVTTNYDTLTFAGPDSEAMLLTVFNVSVLHNIVHLLFGIVGFAMMRTQGAARGYLIGGGIIYLLLWIYGLIVSHESPANFVPLNTADNWLHLGLAVGMIGLGALLGGTARRGAATD